MMMERLVFFFLAAVFFVIYFSVLKYIYSLIPYNIFMNVLSILIMITVIFPASIISANKMIEVIRTKPY